MPLQSLGAGTVVDIVVANWLLMIGLGAVGLLAYWTFQERESAGSTIESVGERADDFFGNLLGGFGSLVFVVLTIMTTVGAQLVDLTGMLIDMVAGGPPLLLVNIAGILVGALGLSGTVDVTAVAWLIVMGVLLFVALGVRERRSSA